MKSIFKAIVSCGVAAMLPVPSTAQTSTSQSPLTPETTWVKRQYRDGEAVVYHMKASNKDRHKTLTYEADARGAVRKNAAGQFYEEFAWTNVIFNGTPVKLAPDAEAFRQTLSLARGFPLTVPDLRPVLKIVGPITDLLTFYADMKVVNEGPALVRAGDHFLFKHGKPTSWADGFYILTGEDSIDFDVTLEAIDRAAQVAVIVVRHVVPEQPQIKIPAEWMRTPVADTPNNWMQVQKNQDGSYIGFIGKETFESRIRVDMRDGRILGATLTNPVELMERACTDAALTKCGEGIRSKILRQIEITVPQA